jgi:integrase
VTISKRDAEAWVRKTESEIERGLWRDTSREESTTLIVAIQRYLVEVTSKKRSARNERSTMGIWLETPIARLSLARITSVETALRRGELSKLVWKDVDLKIRTAHLPKSITKNGYERTVPLSSTAVKIFSELPRNFSGRVFSATPGSMSQAFDRAVQRARLVYVSECEKQGAEPDADFLCNLRLHDLRHEAITRLADKFALYELAKVTGHRDTRMLLRYYHPRAEDLAKRLA